MKIAICNVQEFNPTIGGIERVSVSLAKCLVEQGMKVVFVSCRKSPYSEAYTLPARQLTLPQPVDYCEENVMALANIVQTEHVDILLNQNSHSELYNRTCHEVKQHTCVKLISVLHFSPDMRLKGNSNLINFKYLSFKENLNGFVREMCTHFPLSYITMYDQRRMMKNLYEWSDRVVLLSNEYRVLYKRYSGIKDDSKLTAINNMLSFPYEKRAYEKKKQILYCGRLLFPQKRPDRLLYAWRKIQRELPDWNIVIVGDGPFADEMGVISQRLGLERIEFVGFKDPVAYYKESSIFCMTSNHEGWGLVLTEAMQYGCVPVAFESYESVRDIIDDCRNGLLVKPFDIDAFAAAIAKLANSDLTQFSTNAVNAMERLTPERIVEEWIKLFEETISRDEK